MRTTARGRRVRTPTEKRRIVEQYRRAKPGRGGEVLRRYGVTYAMVSRWSRGLALEAPGKHER